MQKIEIISYFIVEIRKLMWDTHFCLSPFAQHRRDNKPHKHSYSDETYKYVAEIEHTQTQSLLRGFQFLHFSAQFTPLNLSSENVI